MIDLETLGTTADAVIMSIGAVKFDLDSDKIADEGFYASVSVESNLARGRHIDESTLIWWFKQSAEARNVFSESKQTLESALEELSDWFQHDRWHVWSNGADFDIPMLQHAYRQCGMEVPWKYFNNRCFRTFKNLPQSRYAVVQDAGVKHNALDDAFNQAVHAQAIQRVLTGKQPVKAKHEHRHQSA